MSAALVPSWPGSRVLLGWWRELVGRKPQLMRLSYLLVHRVEALVRVRRPRRLDRWQRALLSLANARTPCGGELINSLNDLRMDAQILGQLVRELTQCGLLHRNGAGQWHVTATGHLALQTGTLSTAVEERRTFAFVDNAALGRAPHFLPLSGRSQPSEIVLARGADAPRYEDFHFEAVTLEACLQQSLEWKKRFCFPAEVEAILLPQPSETSAANWRRVLLDSVEHRLIVFIHKGPAPTWPLLGFAVHPENWALDTEPLLALMEGWEEALPDLALEPSPQMWRQAWQNWSHPRSLPSAEVEACRLERTDHRLLVYAPPRLIERLRAARSDAIKQEAWLLAGEGRTRTAAQIELHPL